MKNKKKLFIIGGSALAVILAVILLITLLPKNDDTPSPSETEPTSETSDIVIDDLEKDTEPTESDTSIEETKEIIEIDDPGLTPVDEKQSGETGSSGKTDKKPETTAKPVNEAKPETNKPEGGGVVIGGNTPEPYNCGVDGHHCDGPETHAYVSNLELEGCPYCGSNKCPSFYATDEWGNTCYTPSKCPKYDIHSDPVYYCQKCGKPCGDGTNGTCAEYNVDIDCPNCGEHVSAWTCHSCK